MVTVEEQAPPRLRPANAPLPAGLSERLRERFSPRKLRYVCGVLTPEELAVISDPGDVLIIARIKRMADRRLKRFDDLVPIDGCHRLYHSLQTQWLRDEEYLLGTRLGRPPTHKELFIDFMGNHNGLRFRAYFALKFPNKMRPKNAPAPAAH